VRARSLSGRLVEYQLCRRTRQGQGVESGKKEREHAPDQVRKFVLRSRP